MQNRCIAADAGCVPASCAALGVTCGTVEDGCGHPVDCGCCFWGCNPLVPPCPLEEPTLATGCSIDGQQCHYTEWDRGCCPIMYACSDGARSGGLPMCPY